jgi:hypothetical protein
MQVSLSYVINEIYEYIWKLSFNSYGFLCKLKSGPA